LTQDGYKRCAKTAPGIYSPIVNFVKMLVQCDRVLYAKC
jgi:hypothetical protein